MAFLTLSDLELETFLELLSIGLEAAEDVSHLANALLVFSLDDLLNGIHLKRLRYHGPGEEDDDEEILNITCGIFPLFQSNSPYLHGLCEEPLGALRQPRHRVVDGGVLAELAEEMPHHSRLQVLAGGRL